MPTPGDNVELSAGTRSTGGRRERQRSRRRRSGGQVETSDFAAFTLRVIRAHSRRVGDGDIDCLVDLLAMSRELDAAIATAVTALHEFGYSWTEIADRLGTSRQNARQRWGRRPDEHGEAAGTE
jgi:DNA-directed RNA polymerase specialized sigma24 family protein